MAVIRLVLVLCKLFTPPLREHMEGLSVEAATLTRGVTDRLIDIPN